uniref:Uncharacterized protein n=1 Tax=Setaria italica TaxID=4555 RepID=K3YBS7_SETIT
MAKTTHELHFHGTIYLHRIKKYMLLDVSNFNILPPSQNIATFRFFFQSQIFLTLINNISKNNLFQIKKSNRKGFTLKNSKPSYILRRRKYLYCMNFRRVYNDHIYVSLVF